MRRALLRAVLRAYPADFRDRFGDEFMAFAEARRGEPAYRGAGGALRFWGALALDVARSAPDARVRALGARLARLRDPHRTPPQPPPDDRMGTLRSDLRLALRALGRRPGFTAVVAVTLALGIGATASIFSLVNAVLLQQLPWPNAERMVMVSGVTAQSDDEGLSYPDAMALRHDAPAIEELGVMRTQSVTLTGVERPDRLYGAFVSAGLLRLFGTTPAIGRAFTDEETTAETRAPLVMLSWDTWQTRFGGDPAIVGKRVTLNGNPLTVVGVTAQGLRPPFSPPEVWLPIAYYPNAGGLERGDRSMAVMARLEAGVTLDAARRQAQAVARRAAEAYPETNKGVGAGLRDLKDALVTDARQPLALVMTAVGVLLLIACLNVANLQLARAIVRERETAMRTALGASRGRIARQLLTESLVLALFGGALGLALGRGLLAVLVRTVAADLPTFGEGGVAMDGRVVALTALATAVAGAVAGLFPVWQARGIRAGGMFGARGASASPGAMRGRSALVVGQMALSVVLLATAGLLAHSLLELQRVRPGFDPTNLLTFEFRLPATRYDAPEKIAAMFDRTVTELRAVPGVRAAALVRAAPFGGNMEQFPTAFDGRPLDEPDRALQVHVNVVSEGYFAAAALPLRVGRDFGVGDDARAPMVAVVSEELARRAWPGQSPIGRRLRAAPWDGWATVIGVVASAKHLGLAESFRPQAYVSFRQRPLIFSSAIVRTTGDPEALAEAVRRAVWRVDPDQPIWKVRSMERMLAGSVGEPKALATLTVVFAALALALAALGVFGVMSFAVAQRRRELGIRLALGARAGQLTGMVVRHGLRLTVVALALGLAGALGAGRLIAGQLYGVAPTDPMTLGAVAGVLAAVVLVACWVPARHAGRVDPKVSLQAD